MKPKKPQNGEETLKAILPQKLSEKSAITQRLRRQAKVIISLITLFVLCPLISFHKPHFFPFSSIQQVLFEVFDKKVVMKAE